MKKLISMTDFVLSKKYTATGHENYAHFLKQPLKLWMFVPCDEDGNVLEEPVHYETWLKLHEYEGSAIGFDEHLKYQQAKERCLFDGFDIGAQPLERFVMHQDGFGLVMDDLKRQTIENLVKYNTQLTKTAEKLIGL